MNPLFIVGVPRSGTTLLRELLASCDQICLPENEFQIIPWLISKVKNHEKLTIDEKARLKTSVLRSAYTMHSSDVLKEEIINLDFMDEDSLGGAIQSLLLLGCERDLRSVRYFGDKTPRNLFHLELIREVYPSMKVINIVRDARDVVASMNEAWGTSFIRGACVWGEGVRSAEEYKDNYPDGILSIKYEDLCSDTENVMREISLFLDVEFQEEMLTPRKIPEKMGAAAGKTGVVKGNAYKFDRMSASNLYLVESIVGAELGELNYPLVNEDCKSYSPSAWLLRFLQARDFILGFRRQVQEKGLISGVLYRVRQNLYR